MRIVKTLSALKKYARRPRVVPGRLASQASCFALNTVKASEREAIKVDAIVREAVWGAYARGLRDGKAGR